MAEPALAKETPVTDGPLAIYNASPTALVSSSQLYKFEARLDAAHYNEDTTDALQQLQSSGVKIEELGNVVERVFIPPRFKRIYVDREHGTPFLQGTHLPHFKPADVKFLSRTAHKDLSPWIIRSGWVLVTCSGTIGRTAIALRQWDGWAASQHILRIVPLTDGVCPPGYIYSWLSSPLGQAQFHNVYGAVVDEITANHVESILIPVPQTREQMAIVSRIDGLATQSVEAKERALELDTSAISTVDQLFSEN